MSNHIVLDYISFVNSYQQNVTRMLNICQSMDNNFNTLIQNHAYNAQTENNYERENRNEMRHRRDVHHRREMYNNRRAINNPRMNTLRRPTRMPHTLFGHNINNLMNNLNAHTNTLNEDFFSSVPIIPTSHQITIATELMLFCDTSGTIQNTCPIDLVLFQPNDEVLRIRYCGHFFRPNNLQSWFRTNSRCPVCRYDIRSYNTVSPIQHLDTSNNGLEVNFATQNNNQGETTLLVGGNEIPQNNIASPLNIPHTPESPLVHMQNQLGSVLTTTIMNTFQNMIDPSLNDVDTQYRLFNSMILPPPPNPPPL